MKNTVYTLGTLILLLLPFLGHSQISVSGIVTDANSNEPLGGVEIKVTATGETRLSNSAGEFNVEVPNGDNILSITRKDYLSKRITITDTNISLRIELERESIALNEVVVTDRNRFVPQFNPQKADSEKLPQKITDIPQSIKLVGRDLIDNRQALNFKDIIKNTPGVNVENSNSEVTIRGFTNAGGGPLGSLTLINGMRNFYTGATSDLNLTNIESVEILKGPSSILFGANSPGGSINAITKKPGKEEKYSIGTSGGTWGRYRVDADISTPISENEKVLFRLNAGYQNEQGYRELLFNRNFIVAPTLRYMPSENTVIDVEFVHNSINRSVYYDWGYPSLNQDVFAIPITFTPHEPTDNVQIVNTMLMISLKQRILDNLYLHSNFNSSSNTLKIETHAPSFFNPAPDDNNNVARVYREGMEDNKGAFFGNYLTWKPQTEKVKFTLTGGIDYFESTYFLNLDQAGGLDGVPPINVLNPVYRQASVNTYPAIGGFNAIAFTDFTGVYFLGFTEFGTQLKLLLGGRWDNYNFEGPDRTENITEAFLPNVGLIYEPIKNLSVYGSWNRGFLPQNMQSPDFGGPFDPEYSEQIEIGLKGSFLNDKLSATLAWYNIDRTNVLVPADPVNDPFGIRESSGVAKSRGFEVDVAGEVFPNLSINAGYAYNDSRITQSAYGFEIDRQANNAPFNTLSFWGNYSFKGLFKNAGLAVGVYHIGERTTPGEISYPAPLLQEIPSYTIFEAGLFYRYQNLSFNINIENLFNERYIAGATNAFYLYPGKPRNVMARIQIDL
ncbi:TonB-dependent receptor domain-containing protein [Pricia sp.]|uniref:TonB-dependent receptor domain-containing protein n=1 Tax=Pricia sp. TaxID=2268138 RepID=UPI0035935902